MKLLHYCLIALGISTILYSCGNGKKVAEEPPFPIDKAFVTSWTSGTRGGASGFDLYITLGQGVEIQLDSAYFRGNRAPLVSVQGEEGLFVARFRTPSVESVNPELVMHKDPRKEYGNQVIALNKEVPFKLKANEAVVRYSIAGRPEYFRLSGIREHDTDSPEIKNQ